MSEKEGRDKSHVAYNSLIFFVNGKKVVEKNVDPLTSLADYLRNARKLLWAILAITAIITKEKWFEFFV